MITCRKTTEWLIKKEQAKLGMMQHIQVQAHLAICRACRLFARQSTFLSKALRHELDAAAVSLTAEEKEALYHAVQEKLNSH